MPINFMNIHDITSRLIALHLEAAGTVSRPGPLHSHAQTFEVSLHDTRKETSADVNFIPDRE